MRHYEIDFAKVQIKQNESVSDLRMDEVRIKDFDAYFERFYKNQLEQGLISQLPQTLSWPVNEYKDRAFSFDTTDDHSVLLHVPHVEFYQFISNQTKEQRQLEKLLYECLPSLQDYTNSYMARLHPCFSQQCFTQN